ncbi:MAG: hypothetical protein ACFB0B_07480 [Thermonemataceae bacterium]
MQSYTLFFLLVILCIGALPLNAQFVEKDKREKKDTLNRVETETEKTPSPTTSKSKKKGAGLERFTFGGNFGLSFGSITAIELSPAIGYKVTENLIPGVGGTYMYFSTQATNGVQTFDIETSVYGFRGFLQYIIFENFFLWGEFETLNVEVANFDTDQLEREWVNSPFIGGGYRVPMGFRGAFNFTVLYNLNYQDNRSPYPSPLVIRAGFLL